MSFPCAVTRDLNIYQAKIDKEVEFETFVERQIAFWMNTATLKEIDKIIPKDLEWRWSEFIWDLACYEVERKARESQLP